MRRALIRVNYCHARASEFGELDLRCRSQSFREWGSANDAVNNDSSDKNKGLPPPDQDRVASEITKATMTIEVLTHKVINVAFMEVMMPGKTGVESFPKITKAKPDACLIVMTGFSV